MKQIILATLFSLSSFAADWTLPTANQGNWTPGSGVGVIGGIAQYKPGGVNARTNIIDVTQAPYNADNTGTVSCQVAFDDALTAATAGSVVYFPAGTYLCNPHVHFSKKEITVRGAGPALTTIVGQLSMGIDTGYYHYPETVTGTKTKGTAQLTVGSTSAMNVGQMCFVEVEDERDMARIQAGAAPVFHVAGFTGLRGFHALITAKTSGTVTIDPPLMFDCTNLAVTIGQIELSNLQIRKSGFEDFTLEHSNSVYPIHIYGGSECWVDNVIVNTTAKVAVSFTGSTRAQVTGCWFTGPLIGNTTNGAGLLIEKISNGLFENNILNGFYPSIEVNFGSVNNAFLYNAHVSPTPHGIDTNHGPHNSLNLYEGNVAWNFICDGFFGSASHDTAFRNLLHGCNNEMTAHGGYGHIVRLCRLTRNYILAGNIFGRDGVKGTVIELGYPRMGAGNTMIGTAQPSLGDFWDDWGITGTLTTRISDVEGEFTVNKLGSSLYVGFGVDSNAVTTWWNANYLANMVVKNVDGLVVRLGDGVGILPAAGTVMTRGIYTGSIGYPERDLDVEATTTLTENYHSNEAGIGSVQNGTADTLPSSLAYTAQPSWWPGSLTWPPISPDSPTFSLEIIPAGYRFVNESSPGGGGGTATATSATVAGSVTIGN